MGTTAQEEAINQRWTVIDGIVDSLPADFDVNELRKAISYLRAHNGDRQKLIRYLQELAVNRSFGRSNRTLEYRRNLLQAVNKTSNITGSELEIVLGNAARLLVYKKNERRYGEE